MRIKCGFVLSAVFAVLQSTMAVAAGEAGVSATAVSEATVSEPAVTVVEEPVAAAPALPAWLGWIDVSGLAFLSYSYNFSDGANDYNSFDVRRMYFQIDARPADHIKFQMTLDAPARMDKVSSANGVTTVSKEAGKFDVVLKHAYAEFYDLLVEGLSVRFGMADLPWVPYEESIWSYRFQGPVMADREGYMTSTDLGVAVAYTPDDGRLTGHVALVNGEGWSAPEVTARKDVHARATLRPFVDSKRLRGLSLSAAGVYGAYAGGDDQDRNRAIGQLAYQCSTWAVAAEYMSAWDPASRLVSRHPSLAAAGNSVVRAQAGSIYGWIDFAAFGSAPGVRIMARVDLVDPNVDAANNGHTRIISGVGYRWNRFVEFLVDADIVDYNRLAGVPEDERILALHTQFRF